MFTEYYFFDPDDDSAVGQRDKDSWTLAAFEPRNEPYTEIVVEYLRQSTTTYGWDVQTKVGACTLDKETEKLVGFATTKEDLESRKIASIQPIYLSTD